MKRLAFPCLLVAALAFTACGDSEEDTSEIFGPQLDVAASVIAPDAQATPEGTVIDKRERDRR